MLGGNYHVQPHWQLFATSIFYPDTWWEGTFALVSCEDAVLFFQSHFISVHFGAGFIFSVLQCKNSRWRVEFLHAFKPLYPCYQLSQLYLQGLFFQDLFFLLELLWMLPSGPADSSAPKSVSGFLDTLQCTKTSLPLVLCHLPLPVVPSPLLQGHETENKSTPPDTLLPSSTHLQQWQWLCRESPRWPILRAFLCWDRCWRGWRSDDSRL